MKLILATAAVAAILSLSGAKTVILTIGGPLSENRARDMPPRWALPRDYLAAYRLAYRQSALTQKIAPLSFPA